MYQWFACFSWCILTKHRYYLPNTHTTTSKDIVFRADFSRHTPSFFLYFLSVCSPFSAEVWHLWQQKNNIAVGVRAPMCAYACTRETFPKKFSLHVFPRFLFFLLLLCLFPHSPSFPLTSLFFSSGAFNTCESVFCYMCIADLLLRKEKNALFHDFFTLWGNIFPYTNRGMRCKPPSVQELMTCIEH